MILPSISDALGDGTKECISKSRVFRRGFCRATILCMNEALLYVKYFMGMPGYIIANQTFTVNFPRLVQSFSANQLLFRGITGLLFCLWALIIFWAYKKRTKTSIAVAGLFSAAMIFLCWASVMSTFVVVGYLHCLEVPCPEA